jgi:hypothetical protein
VVKRPNLVGAVVAALVASTATAQAAHTPAALYWKTAPPAGAQIVISDSRRPVLRIAAAAAAANTQITLSLLGVSPARLDAVSGNPASGVLRLPSRGQLGSRTFAVTFVARTAGTRALAITRTVVITIRQRTISLLGPGALSRWAYLRNSTVARAAPSALAPVTGDIPRTTADSMPNLVRLLAESRDRSGVHWAQVAFTALPNGRTGWVRRTDLSVYHVIATRVVVDSARLTLTLFRHTKPIFRAPVGIGQAKFPTPQGVFYVREKLTHFHDPFYGSVAFGTSARSPTLTDWPGGGIVGIHGTNRPDLIPGRVSHGCIRLRNADIRRLARLLPLGTPVEIR